MNMLRLTLLSIVLTGAFKAHGDGLQTLFKRRLGKSVESTKPQFYMNASDQRTYNHLFSRANELFTGNSRIFDDLRGHHLLLKNGAFIQEFGSVLEALGISAIRLDPDLVVEYSLDSTSRVNGAHIYYSILYGDPKLSPIYCKYSYLEPFSQWSEPFRMVNGDLLPKMVEKRPLENLVCIDSESEGFRVAERSIAELRPREKALKQLKNFILRELVNESF